MKFYTNKTPKGQWAFLLLFDSVKGFKKVLGFTVYRRSFSVEFGRGNEWDWA